MKEPNLLEQNMYMILARHRLSDTLQHPEDLAQEHLPVSNLHSRLVAATDEIGKLRSDSETAGEVEHERLRAVTARLEADVKEAYGRSVMEDEIPGQLKRNKELAARIESLDPWQHRAQHMRCQTCMWYVPKATVRDVPELGRCRHNAPTLKGYPAVFPTDWCGDHKLDETKL